VEGLKMNQQNHDSKHGRKIVLNTPADFNFEEALAYLGRSDQEILHRIENGKLYKLSKINDVTYLLKVSHTEQRLHIEFLTGKPGPEECAICEKYIRDLFDLDSDLSQFYQLAKEDDLLAPLVEKYHGLRIVGLPDIFEATTWAIIGQQINLKFAYILKKRIIENFGEQLTHEGFTYWLFPTAERMSTITVKELTDLQFTTRKAEYVIGVAKLIASGSLIKENLQKESPDRILESLVSIRGIGHWTAQYVMMRCFHIPSAFPISDVGLHNALKAQLHLSKKPTIPEIEIISQHWEGWQAYATFYLWRTLHD
jgi:DNA-3-methyladenine glycosylase II